MGGYLLGGGYSPLGYFHSGGPACYSIRAAEVVLANAQKVHTSPEENPDLFWALCGCGPGFFGVVTRYYLNLYEHPSAIMENRYTCPLSVLKDVLAVLDELNDSKDERLEISIALRDADKSSTEMQAHLRIRAISTHSEDAEAEVSSLLVPYRRSRLASLAVSIEENKKLHFTDLLYSPNRNDRHRADNIWTDDANALIAVAEHCKSRPSGSHVLMTLFHGRQNNPFRKDVCYSSTGRHFLSSHLLWGKAQDDDANLRWYEDFNEIVKPYTVSHYVNQINNDLYPERARNSFSEENWRRLSFLRQKYDPENRFHTYLGYQ